MIHRRQRGAYSF